MSIKSKLFFAISAGLVLMCGCKEKSDFEALAENSEAVQTSETETSFEKPEIEAKHYSFDEIENISDEELIGLADYARWNYPQNLFIEDYFEPVNGEYFHMKFIPEGADLDEYCREERHYPMYCEYYDDKVKDGTCKDRLVEHIEDNDVYSAWKGSYTEIRNTGTCYFHQNILFMKNFSEDGNRYTGEMTADEIARNFDILTWNQNERKVCRRVVETEDAFTYEYYFVEHYGGDWHVNCEIELKGRFLDISKEDGSFPCGGFDFSRYYYDGCNGERLTYARRCEIPDSAPKQPWDE